MIKSIGSQNREKIEDTEYEVYRVCAHGEVILHDTEMNRYEVWAKNDNFAGYVLEINGIGYEFCRGSA